MAGPTFARFSWRDGEEWMMRLGPDDGPVAVVAPPLFEEANRTRAVIVDLLRALAARGIAGALPDLPGQGDSRARLEAQTILSMQVAYEAAVCSLGRQERHCYGVAIRSGALLDNLGLLHGRWRLSPQGGSSLARELTRVKQAEVGATRRLGERWWFDADLPEGAPVSVAGNLLSPDLLMDLSLKEPFAEADIPSRVVRLATDAAPADLHLPGSPPWRRAEPDRDPALSGALAADLADWIAACERR